MPAKFDVIVDWDVNRALAHRLVNRIVEFLDVRMIQGLFCGNPLLWVEGQQLSEKILGLWADACKHLVECWLGLFLDLA